MLSTPAHDVIFLTANDSMSSFPDFPSTVHFMRESAPPYAMDLGEGSNLMAHTCVIRALLTRPHKNRVGVSRESSGVSSSAAASLAALRAVSGAGTMAATPDSSGRVGSTASSYDTARASPGAGAYMLSYPPRSFCPSVCM